MKTAKEVQEFIFEKTGLKTTVKTNKGSMKGYITIRPLFQNGVYENFPHDLIVELKSMLSEYNSHSKPVFCALSQIDIYGITDERAVYKKERKPKPVDENTPQKGWGSKNSQMRLDKAASRYAKKLRKGGCATYY